MATIRYLNQRFASQAAIRQVESLVKADRDADALESQVRKYWRRLIDLAESGAPAFTIHARALGLSHELITAVQAMLIDRLTTMAQWSHKHTAEQATKTLPLGLLQAAALLKASPLREADVRLANLAGLQAIDLAAPLRHPDMLTDDEQRELFRSLLFPSPPAEQVRAWVSRILPMNPTVGFNGFSSPSRIADQFSASYAAGKAPREIANDILPLVDNIRVSARRTARTWGQYVAHKAQQQAHDQLGDLTIGEQVHATLDQNTRPAHRFRNGTIYYKNPRSGQKGYDEKPDPPLEADGSMAWNCRCHLSPVLSPPEHLINDPSRLAIFHDARDKIVMDPLEYGQWFAAADEKRRRLAVGARRYATVKSLLNGEEPRYEHFVSSKTGELLPLSVIKREGEQRRGARAGRVREIMAMRANDLATIATYGFLRPEPQAIPVKAAGRIG